jgi:hypothetical protein
LIAYILNNFTLFSSLKAKNLNRNERYEVPLKHNLRQTCYCLHYELPSATNVACVHPIRLKGARAAGYAIRQILCCGIVKASY